MPPPGVPPPGGFTGGPLPVGGGVVVVVLVEVLVEVEVGFVVDDVSVGVVSSVTIGSLSVGSSVVVEEVVCSGGCIRRRPARRGSSPAPACPGELLAGLIGHGVDGLPEVVDGAGRPVAVTVAEERLDPVHLTGQVGSRPADRCRRWSSRSTRIRAAGRSAATRPRQQAIRRPSAIGGECSCGLICPGRACARGDRGARPSRSRRPPARCRSRPGDRSPPRSRCPARARRRAGRRRGAGRRCRG